MEWSILVIVVGVCASILASNIRRNLQDSLAHRRKLKSSGSRDGNLALLIILFPITLYILVGTLLLLLLYMIETVTKKLLRYCGDSDYEVIAWHQASIFLTLLFPLLGPAVALMVGLVFFAAIFLALLQTIRIILTAIVQIIHRIWVNIIHALQALLDRIMDSIRSVWERIVDGTQTIWDLIVDGSQDVLEQTATLVQNIWTTISDAFRS